MAVGAKIVAGAKVFICSREIAGGCPSFGNGRAKVIVGRVIGVRSRKVAGIYATVCSSRR
jgi:hypothetical protein